MQLKKLDLSQTPIDRDGLEALAVKFPKLNTLSVLSTNLTDDDVVKVLGDHRKFDPIFYVSTGGKITELARLQLSADKKPETIAASHAVKDVNKALANEAAKGVGRIALGAGETLRLVSALVPEKQRSLTLIYK